MTTPSGQWEPINETMPGNALATSQYDITAGLAVMGGGVVPTIAFTFRGVLANDVGDPDAKQYQITALLQTEDVDRFALQAHEATLMRPE